MKKLLFICIALYGVSCTNPEDRATGDTDSTSFNSNEQNVLNSRPGATDPNSQGMNATDSNTFPGTRDQNANSTNGTNRPYMPGADSLKK